MGFNNFLRDYFTFNRKERNGVFILISLILLLILYLSFADSFYSEERTDFSQFEKDIAVFNQQLSVSDSFGEIQYDQIHYDYPPSSEEKTGQKQYERFYFNPNHLPDEDWKKLGLTDRQIRIVKNYESKGGKFRTKEDVKKMYCITPELYASLESYIQIPGGEKSEKAPELEDKWVVELNSADTTALKKIKGIGSAFAIRIVKYRELLGGYILKEQLLEVYGLNKEKYDEMAAFVSVDVARVRKTNINEATAGEMKSHPYIKWKLANVIVAYRKNHGSFSSVEGIRKIDLVNDSLFTKIAPYLTVE